MLYPHYLRSFPSCSIVQLDFRTAAAELPEIVTLIPRGTVLKAPAVRGIKCKFRTSSDIRVAPVAIESVHFASIINAPGSIRLPADASSSIDITFRQAGRTGLAAIALDKLSLFLDAEPTLAASLRDVLFTRVAAAYVSFAGGGWRALDAVPLQPAGFADTEALIPFSAR